VAELRTGFDDVLRYTSSSMATQTMYYAVRRGRLNIATMGGCIEFSEWNYPELTEGPTTYEMTSTQPALIKFTAADL